MRTFEWQSDQEIESYPFDEAERWTQREEFTKEGKFQAKSKAFAKPIEARTVRAPGLD